MCLIPGCVQHVPCGDIKGTFSFFRFNCVCGLACTWRTPDLHRNIHKERKSREIKSVPPHSSTPPACELGHAWAGVGMATPQESEQLCAPPCTRLLLKWEAVGFNRERESVCVCVCVRERERDRVCASVCVYNTAYILNTLKYSPATASGVWLQKRQSIPLLEERAYPKW